MMRLEISSLIVLCCLYSSATADDPADFFGRQVAPILQRHCLSCHNRNLRKGDLSLEDGQQLLSGELIDLKSPADSPLLQLIRRENGVAEMPKDAEPLKPSEVAAIRKWIESGASWPASIKLKPPQTTNRDWWSLQPLHRPAVPAVGKTHRHVIRNPIDAFVVKRLSAAGINPSPVADRRTLIRRLHYDLIGLPPHPEVVAEFVASRDPLAYEKLVDRLLDSPQFGERWARHWLDVSHYADTHGYDKDKLRTNAWPYRDYVIRALNSDKRYARFVREQLAGDVLYPGTQDGIVALGFLAAGPWDFIGHAEVPESKIDGQVARHLDRDDMVSTTMNVFTSMTVQCAQCHNHKFDPVTQQHYYRLQAVFAAVDRADRPFDNNPTLARTRQELARREHDTRKKQDQINTRIAQLATPEMRKLKTQITAARKQQAQQSQSVQGSRSSSYGYHSQVAASPHTTKWVQVDLGKSIPIEQIVLFGADEYGWSDFGFPDRYKLEVADDPGFRQAELVIDHTQHDVARPGQSAVVVPCSATARYVRITATRLWERRRAGASGNGDWIFALGELAVISDNGLARPTAVTALDSIEAAPRWSRENLIDQVYGRQALDDRVAVDQARSPSNGFHSEFANRSETTKWFQLEFEAPITADSIELVPAFPTDWKPTPGFGFPARFVIEASETDNFSSPRIVWDARQADMANPGNRAVHIRFPRMTIRRIRLTATRLWDRGNAKHALAMAEVVLRYQGQPLPSPKNITASDSINSGRWHTRFLADGFTSRRQLADTPRQLLALAGPPSSPSNLQQLQAAYERLEQQTLPAPLLTSRKMNAEELSAIQRQIQSLPAPGMVYAATVHKGQGAFRGRHGLGPRPIHLLYRGNVTNPGPRMQPGTVPLIADEPSEFPMAADHREGERRAALAEWIVRAEHPLTWRSIANRIWLHHFGRGLVDTPNDFGRMGQAPSHPKLLDWLACEMRDTQGSMKRLHRLIVSSHVYRQASRQNPVAARKDASNQLLWRADRRRLDAESIRDSVLQVSGLLRLHMHGPGFRDFVLEKPQHSPHYEYHKHDPDDTATHRRAVYRFLVRSQQEPFMETLDCADPSQLVAKRNETLTSLQSLALMNNKFMLRMAQHFADRLEREAPDLDSRLRRGFLLTLGRQPTADERQTLTALATQYGLANACRVLFNLNEFIFID